MKQKDQRLFKMKKFNRIANDEHVEIRVSFPKSSTVMLLLWYELM